MVPLDVGSGCAVPAVDLPRFLSFVRSTTAAAGNDMVSIPSAVALKVQCRRV